MRRQIASNYGKQISAHVAGGERSVDTGLIASSRLLATLLEARIGLGMAACVQGELVQEAGAIVAEGLASRERFLKLHAKLALLGDRFGLDPRAFGDGGDKDENIVTSPSGILHEVANAA